MRHRWLIIAIVPLTCLLLAACHSVSVKSLVPPNLRAPDAAKNSALDEAKKALADATPCCNSFADFSYQQPLPWKPRAFTLGAGSPVAHLGDTRSYFLAFSLPQDAKQPYRIGIKSELNGRWLSASYLFAPTVVVLDAAFQPLASKDVSLCEYMGWTDASSGAFGSVTVNNPEARYLVVYSSAKQQSDGTYWEQSPAAFSADQPVSMTSTGSFKVPHGPNGTIWIGMMNSSYAKAVDNAVCGKPPKGDGVIHTIRTALPAVGGIL